MSSGGSYRGLVVWQKAIHLAEEVYSATASFPADERYGMTAQLRRGVVSIAANIAEGSARATSKDFAGFISIAIGSNAEMETFVELAQRFGYLSEGARDGVLDHCHEGGRMLTALRASLVPRGSTRRDGESSP